MISHYNITVHILLKAVYFFNLFIITKLFLFLMRTKFNLINII